MRRSRHSLPGSTAEGFVHDISTITLMFCQLYQQHHHYRISTTTTVSQDLFCGTYLHHNYLHLALTRSIYHKAILYSTRLFFPHDRFFFPHVLLCHIAYHVKKFTPYERDGLLRWLDVISNLLHGRIQL